MNLWTNITLVLALLLSLAGISGCGDGQEKQAETLIKDLKAAGAMVQAGKLEDGGGRGGKRMQVNLGNLTSTVEIYKDTESFSARVEGVRQGIAVAREVGSTFSMIIYAKEPYVVTINQSRDVALDFYNAYKTALPDGDKIIE